MLSEQEKQDLKAMASSAELRRDFELLRHLSRERQRTLSLDQYLSFLTAMSRLSGVPATPRPPASFANAKL